MQAVEAEFAEFMVSLVDLRTEVGKAAIVRMVIYRSDACRWGLGLWR